MARKRAPRSSKKSSPEEDSNDEPVMDIFLESEKEYVFAQESELRSSKEYLKGISVRDFLGIYKKLYFLITNTEPEGDADLINWGDEERTVKQVVAEDSSYLAKMLEDKFPKMVFRWCYIKFRVNLDNRAMNLHAYDQLTEFGQQLLKENSYTFNQWYKKLYQTTYIEEEEKVQLDRSLLNFNSNPPGDLCPDNLIDGEEFFWRAERAALKELQELLANRLTRVEIKLKTSVKIWPSDNLWWERSREIQDKCGQYKYFEPLLVELNKLRLGFKKSKDLSIRYRIQPPEKWKIWALINHEKIGESIHIAGIPTKTYVKYRTAFFKSGIFKKVHKIQNGPAIIAIGTYNDTHSRQRVSRFLKANTTGRASDFKLGKR
jgi:hypothetical protein